jgi:hypothetical protein
MIQFTMKILDYSAGTYKVEYIPSIGGCSPIKLSIQVDGNTATNSDLVLEKLKAASPQDYWESQLNIESSAIANQVASQLVQTTHVVNEASNLPLNSVNAFYVQSGIQMPTQVVMPAQMDFTRNFLGNSTPEQVTNPDDQSVVKLKILIQQVIQELAEGTV